jgi:O-antigen/teichoic acid export membrane protein
MTFLKRLLGAALGIVFLLAALVFAAIALGIALAVGIVAWGWLWWRPRSLPRRHTIEGEYRDVTNLERLEQRGGKRL